jgi:hypothetical protein
MARLQQQVIFRFERDMDVRHLATVPAMGDLVTHRGALWTVSRVEADGQGAIVICELSAGGGSHPAESD